MKKVLTFVLCIVMLTATFAVISSAANTPNGCTHPNMTTTVVSEQLPDCYHKLNRETLRKCPDCGYEETFVEVGTVYQHGEIETTVTETPATCVSYGWISMSAVCKECGQKVDGAIQPTSKVQHSVKIGEEYPDCYIVQERAVAGNCDSYGFHEKVLYCTECNCVVKVLEKEQLPMSEHYWTNWEVKDGVEERHCISCGKIERQEQVLADPIVVSEVIVTENECVLGEPPVAAKIAVNGNEYYVEQILDYIRTLLNAIRNICFTTGSIVD